MSLRFPPGAADKLRKAIAAHRRAPGGVADDVFAALVRIDEDPNVGRSDKGVLLGGCRIYQFRVERLPIVLRFTIAYDVVETVDGHETWILDMVPRFVDEE